LVPAKLKKKTQRDFALLRRHWKAPKRIHIMSYELLSRDRGLAELNAYKPDLIVADEAHKTKNKSAACTRRLHRYLTKDHPEAHYVDMSGTITKRSILEYNHRLNWAVPDGLQALPRDFNETRDWADALDEKPGQAGRLMPGALLQLCDDDELLEIGKDPRKSTAVRIARQAYCRRLMSAPGVIGTEEQFDGAMSLIIQGHEFEPNEKVLEAFQRLRDDWEMPDGNPIDQPTKLWAAARQLIQGFWYRWSPPPPPEWLHWRKAWAAVVREVLRNYRDIDSPLGVSRAVEEGRIAWAKSTLAEWRAIKGTFKPNTVAEWIDDSCLQWVIDWAGKNTGIIWVHEVAFGERLSKESGLPYYGKGGQCGKKMIEDELGTCIASIGSNSEGRNLQQFSNNLMVSCPPGGAVWEQCVDAETEILTEEGWIGIGYKRPLPLVAAYDIKDGAIDWAEGARIERRLGREKMYGIQNPHLDIRVTAGHRMVHEGIKRLGPGGADGFHYTERVFVAADKLPQKGRVPVNGMQQAPGVPLTDAELVFIGLFMTDGNLSKGNNAISLFQSDRYPEIITLIEQTLQTCGFKYHRSVMSERGSTTNFGVRKHALHRWAVSYGNPKGRDKHLRGWKALEQYIDKDCAKTLESMTPAQLRMLLKGMWAGDGAKKPHIHYEPKTLSICTARSIVAARIQSLCIRRGMRCNITRNREASVWMMHVSEDRTWSVLNMRIGDGRPSWGRLTSDPSERVWCMTVATGAIVIRRNGKVAIVGNCLGRTHRDGQSADEVNNDLLLGCYEQWDVFRRAMREAEYIERTTAQCQKLNFADVTVQEEALIEGRHASGDPLWNKANAQFFDGQDDWSYNEQRVSAMGIRERAELRRGLRA
jgi:hypothetical protein